MSSMRVVSAVCLAFVSFAAGASAWTLQEQETLVISGPSGLYLVDTSGKNLRPFYRGYARDATWSPDGRAVAFVGRDGIAIKPIGGAVRIIRRNAKSRFAHSLSWSPDATSLAFIELTVKSSGGIAMYRVMIVSRDGRSSRQLLEVPPGCTRIPPQRVAWAPDGKHLAIERGCLARAGPLQGIWLHDLRGRTIRQLVRRAYSPSWSPTGEQLAFERNCSLWVIDVARGRERQIPGRGCPFGEASWAPDGTRVAVDMMLGRCTAYDERATTVTIVEVDSGASGEPSLSCRMGYSEPSWRP